MKGYKRKAFMVMLAVITAICPAIFEMSFSIRSQMEKESYG